MENFGAVQLLRVSLVSRAFLLSASGVLQERHTCLAPKVVEGLLAAKRAHRHRSKFSRQDAELSELVARLTANLNWVPQAAVIFFTDSVTWGPSIAFNSSHLYSSSSPSEKVTRNQNS